MLAEPVVDFLVNLPLALGIVQDFVHQFWINVEFLVLRRNQLIGFKRVTVVDQTIFQALQVQDRVGDVFSVVAQEFGPSQHAVREDAGV